MKKSSYRHLSGVFLLNKPLGLSSNSALQKVRRLFNAQKAGHTGALDPLATGLLPICLGEATKFSHYLLDSTKRYQTTVKLGQTTTTGDAEGEILQQRETPALTAERIEQILAQFRGDIQQVPPMYSALKRDGRPLYELARQGIEIERAARPVTIYELTLIDFTEDSLTLDVTCSKGTYIRVLGEDIGEALGCGGHLTKLHRTQTGHFEINPDYSIEYLESLTLEQRDALLLPVYAPVEHFPKVQLPEGREKYFCNGQESNIEHEAAAEVLVFDGERCLGLAEITDKKRLVPKRLLNLYIPLMFNDVGLDITRHALAEHHEMDELVEKLEETDMSNPGWLAIAKQLSEKVHHHLKEEEHKFFQQAGKILEDAEKEILAKKYLAEYHKYKTVEA